MLPELYRSFETSTLKDLVSYGDPADEDPTAERWVRDDDEAPTHQRAEGQARRSRSPLRRKKGKWLRLGQRPTTRTGLR